MGKIEDSYSSETFIPLGFWLLMSMLADLLAFSKRFNHFCNESCISLGMRWNVRFSFVSRSSPGGDCGGSRMRRSAQISDYLQPKFQLLLRDHQMFPNQL